MKHKNKINDSEDNMSLLEHNNHTIAEPEYSNIAEACEKDLKTNCMKMIDVFKRNNTL